VYKVQFQTTTNCASDTKEVTISCKCEKKLVAEAGRDETSLYQCAGNNQYDYNYVTLNGAVSYSSRDLDVSSVGQCVTKPAETVKCSDYQSCCAATECCPKPACPTCASCPACPTCPSPNAGSVGAPLRAAPVPGAVHGAVGEQKPQASDGVNAAPAMSTAAFSSSSEDEQVESNIVFGIWVPTASILVINLVGNLILFGRIRAKSAA
jgi:hypothetical protein